MRAWNSGLIRNARGGIRTVRVILPRRQENLGPWDHSRTITVSRYCRHNPAFPPPRVRREECTPNSKKDRRLRFSESHLVLPIVSLQFPPQLEFNSICTAFGGRKAFLSCRSGVEVNQISPIRCDVNAGIVIAKNNQSGRRAHVLWYTCEYTDNRQPTHSSLNIHVPHS